ncbi:AAA family ATPase [Acinetobacter sp. VNH17]|uniref:AAA family ATPase n=1 Tax=Acinetobacter thutiue TaxID=2998078 RepID=A0ABT7WN04_9GAMM|nr:AAA family ATPase [Acinetobacter thutiue]MCY6411961.1 AAA family ATPase [Acinetobacter thutiue]MDN0014065.1 AAA family ATPase [Acinetobacter thutiue]
MSALKQLLKDHKVNQNTLSKPMGVSVSAVNLFVNHGQKPKKNPDQFQSKFIELLEEKGIASDQIQQALTTAQTHTNNDQALDSECAADSSEDEQLMLLRKQTLTPAAKKHFKLFKNIFDEPIRSAAELFNNSDINYVRESMWQAAKGNSSFIALVGQSGAGKSTLRRELIDRIEREREPVIVIEPYVLASEDNDIKGKTLKSSHITESILAALAPSTPAKRSPEARARQIHNLLKESSRAGYRHLLIVEEAQSLSIPTLKHFKRFLELENGFTPLISIILIGQDELKIKLSENNPEIREVVQRCEIVTLEPFTQNSLVDYLQHRCKAADRKLSDFIDESGLDAICTKLTRNVGRKNQHESLLYPLAVGNLITGAMNVAAELGAPVITADLVMEV